MPYGAIFRNATAAGGALAHTMLGGVGGYCTYLIQDVTTAGAQQPLQRLFVATADKLAATVAVTDNTVAGACNVDLLLLEGHSAVDVGPVAGATRAAAAIYGGIIRTSSCRSLHADVRFTSPGAVANVDVTVTHLLNSTNVVAFASPTSDMDNAVGGGIVRCFLQATPTADTVTMRIVASAGANIDAGNYDWDIVIMKRTAVGLADIAPQPYTMTPHRATAGANIGLPSDDYSGADVARATANVFGRDNTAALYTNVDAIVAGGLVMTHNMGAVAGAMCLVGHAATPAAGWPVITNNATSVNTMTVARQGADINNANVYFVRPYSIFIPTLTNVP